MARTKSSQVWRSALFNRRKIIVFLLCLGVSSLLWLLLAFNEFYTSRFVVPVKYINMPNDNLLMDHLPKEAEIEVSGSGFHILSYRLRPQLAEVIIDGRNMGTLPAGKKNGSFLTTLHAIDYFNRLHGDIKALNIFPDTIFFTFFNRGFNKVPVQVSSYLEFVNQYGLVDSMRVTPDSITLTGPAELTKTITKVETDPLILNNLNKSGSYNLKVKQPHPELSFQPAEVAVHLEIDQFTEAVVEVPVFLDHLIQRDSLSISPQTVKVVFQVALKNYKKIKPEDFQIVADMHDLKVQKGGRLILKAKKVPPYAKQIRIKPESVETIIRKR